MDAVFLNPTLFQFVLLGLLCFAAYAVSSGGAVRQARDVLEDLYELHERHPAREAVNEHLPRPGASDLSAIGLFTKQAQRQYEVRRRATPFVFSIIIVIGYMLFGSGKPGVAAACAVFGFAIGYIFVRSRRRKLEEEYTRSLEYFLPIVMERLVMAVQAGLDVIPALKAIVELDQKTLAHENEGVGEDKGRTLAQRHARKQDPVSELLLIVTKLTESGLGFEQALRDVAGLVNSSALRHAFIHLAVAQKEGGEIIMPLRELSDSTQLYFQESAEEEIAKLPIKATLPLICTFAGLILCFITSPLIQVLALTTRAMPK